MSASDAAPLPRLGEVFFDVRGHSRSMRLSWYADTGIAVFSIWQGGRCTGTFRLPIDDLARMTEILQRGPQRRRTGREYERGHGEASYGEASYGEASYGEASYGEASYGEASYGEGEYHEDWFEDEGNRPTGHLPDGLERTAAYPDRRRANRPSADRDSTGYERPARYADSAGYERPAGYADSAAEPGASDAAGRYEFPTQAVRPPDGSYLRTSAGHDRGAVADLDGYSHERFVPPYLGSGGEGYPNDNPAAGPAPRHSAGGTAYLADRRSDSAEPGDYLSSPDSEAGYSGGSDYRLAADPGVTAEYATGRHSGQRMRSSPASPLAETELGASAEPLSDRDYWRRQAR